MSIKQIQVISTDKPNSDEQKKSKKYHPDVILLDPRIDKEEKLKFKTSYLIIIGLIFILFTGSITAVSLLQNSMFQLFIQNETELIEENLYMCNLLDFSNINLLSHPLSVLLILIYMFLFWRRSCCLKCLFARPAPPMIVHPFKKNDRFFTAAIYGLIAFKVMPIVFNSIFKSNNSDIYAKIVYDPSGLFKLTLRIIEVFLAALRYYPPLIAFCADSLFVYITSTFYMLVDFSSNIIIEGKCEGFDSINQTEDRTEIETFGKGKIAFLVINDLPQFFLLSLITSVLLYRSIDRIINCKKQPRKMLINEDLKFFSIHDIKYCLYLINDAKKPKSKQNLIKRIIERFIYKWEPHFKFSSRIINSHVVAFLSLYYFFMTWLSYGIILIKSISGKADNAISSLINVFGEFDLQLPFEKNIFIYDAHIAGFVLSAVISFIICIIHCFLGLRSIQENLLKMYKGQKNDLPKLGSNASVSNGNTHFAGFLVGFLLNGFLFIFAFLFLICLIIYYICQFSTWDEIGQILLKIVPILTVFIAKFIFNFICSRFIFLQQRSKVLALDNFRAYSVFVYVTFFFDCFIGAINALIRLLIGLIGAIFFMPRIGYSFLGRQLEFLDAGHRVSTGYYTMEATHSHPVLLTFCALVYYKRLLYKLDNFNSWDLYQMIKNRKPKKIEPTDSNISLIQNLNEENKSVTSLKNVVNLKMELTTADKKAIKKNYNQRIFNKWCLIITLINNNCLIFYRKEQFSHRKFLILDSDFKKE